MFKLKRVVIWLVMLLGVVSCGTKNTVNSADCVKLVIATSSEKINLMDELGKVFQSTPEAAQLPNCVSVLPINVSSGSGAQTLATNPKTWPLPDQNYWPTIWSPASTIWTDRVAASGNANLVKDAKSFAQTPVVFAMPESMAAALNYPKKSVSISKIKSLIADPNGWKSVGKPLWGAFKIAKTNPNTSTTGLSMILMQSYAAANKNNNLTAVDVKKSAKFSKVFESGAIHYGDTTGKVLTTLFNASQTGSQGSAYVSAVAVEETSLYNYNLGNPDSHTVQPGEELTPPREKLVAVYPSEGSMFSDNPAVVLSSPWVSAEQKSAGEVFLKFLQTQAAQEILPKYGFRPVKAGISVAKYLNPQNGINANLPKIALPKPNPAVVSEAIDQWARIRKPAAVLEVIDTSGSMEEMIDANRSKLDGAIDGAKNTLGHFRGTDRVGVWAFTTGLQSKYGAGVAEVRKFSPLAGDKEKLSTAIEDLKKTRHEGTPLYDAIDTAYRFMQTKAAPGRINAIVVLSDGEDADSTTSLASLLVRINSSAKEGATQSPVRIFTIAYGSGANKEVLAQISKASGGQMFDATDPAKIDAVFASVINNF